MNNYSNKINAYLEMNDIYTVLYYKVFADNNQCRYVNERE